jgi:hypothetical protein
MTEKMVDKLVQDEDTDTKKFFHGPISKTSYLSKRVSQYTTARLNQLSEELVLVLRKIQVEFQIESY